ncbi:MAG: cell division protein FtsZ [Pseudomonadota bacterium]
MPLNLGVPDPTDLSELKPRISVVGIGGAGGNAVNNMIESSLEGVEFVVANTDAQALGLSKSENRIQLGEATTRGLGAGSLPEVGRAAAEESLEEIVDYVGDSHMLFITAGMGGGTGTGAAPVIARAAREREILTVGVVTKPFHFEGARRMKIAQAGIEELQQHVDTLLIIPNQNLFAIANERTTFHEAFALADQVLHSGVRGITDLMVMPGLINLDFNDVRTVMSEMGKAMMGTGEAEGDKRAIEAAEAAISNPLLDEVSMKGARGVLINITGSMDMTLFEVDEAANRIRAEVDPEANIIVGSTFNQDLEGKVRVSVVATGIDAAQQTVAPAKPAAAAQAGGVRPWRSGEGARANGAPAQDAQVAVSAVSSAPHIGTVQPNAQVSVPPVANKAADAANPVGDVQARIRKMLMEGAPPEAGTAQNPFRDNGAKPAEPKETGIGAIGAAFSKLTSPMNTARKPADDGTQTVSPAAQTAPAADDDRASGTLFDDDDADLEIPSFLRKKKVG